MPMVPSASGKAHRPLPCPGNTTLESSTDIDGWTVILTGNIDIAGSAWTASEGSLSIDLDGTFPGGIEQSFTKVPGRSYHVSFDLAGNTHCSPLVKEMRVEVDSGAQATDHSFDIDCFDAGIMGWKRIHFEFVASGTATTLTFRSLHPSGSCGAALDNVVVQDVTLTVCLAENYCGGAPNSVFCSGSRIRTGARCRWPTTRSS